MWQGSAWEQQQGEEQHRERSSTAQQRAQGQAPSPILSGWTLARACTPWRANHSSSACKGSLLFTEPGRFLCFLFWAKLPLYLFTISRAAGGHWH